MDLSCGKAKWKDGISLYSGKTLNMLKSDLDDSRKIDILISDKISNELIELPNINRIQKKKYIEKEVLKRRHREHLVDYRYIDKDYVLISTIDLDFLKELILIFDKTISSVRSRLDFLLDYIYEIESNNFILINPCNNGLELYVDADNIKALDIIAMDGEFDMDILKFELENELEDYSDIDYIYIYGDESYIKDDFYPSFEAKYIDYREIVDCKNKG